MTEIRPTSPEVMDRPETDGSAAPLVAQLVNASVGTTPQVPPREPVLAQIVDFSADPSPARAATASGQPRRPSVLRRLLAYPLRIIKAGFRVVSLIVILAVVTAIPIVQLIAFGYLIDVAGRLTRGERLRDAVAHLKQAGTIGLAATGVLIAALPTQLLVHFESVASVIEPGSTRAVVMRVLAVASSMLATCYLLWVWARGGKLRHYIMPQPIRFAREGLRWKTWSSLPDQLWDFTASLEAPRYFWLGLRAFVGTLIWLIPAMVVMSAFRVGETGLAGVVGFLAIVGLAYVFLYLPMLQAHFAAENRLSALMEVRQVRSYFRRAPWAWFFAMLTALIITPIPLYLLKIEATQREVMWLPCMVFVAFILPARIATGLALRRARRRPESTTAWGKLSRVSVRVLMLPVVAVYVLFVYISQYTSWDGLQTWVQQHAVLIPVPFLNGV